MLRPALASVLLLTLAQCDSPKAPKTSVDRLTKAEAAMAEVGEQLAARRL